MGIFKSIKNLFSKKSKTSGKKVEVETKPEVIITNLGKGGKDKETTRSIDDLGIQTTFNTDSIDELVEDGEVENVSD